MLLVHQRGRWQGRQLIPEAWLQESFSNSSPPRQKAMRPSAVVVVGVVSVSGRVPAGTFGKGFGGQRPIVLPDLDTIIVVTGWNILPVSHSDRGDCHRGCDVGDESLSGATPVLRCLLCGASTTLRGTDLCYGFSSPAKFSSTHCLPGR